MPHSTWFRGGLALIAGVLMAACSTAAYESDSGFEYFPEHQAERTDVTSCWDHLGEEVLDNHFIRNYIADIKRVMPNSSKAGTNREDR